MLYMYGLFTSSNMTQKSDVTTKWNGEAEMTINIHVVRCTHHL